VAGRIVTNGAVNGRALKDVDFYCFVFYFTWRI
jgi:hypothetical protein